MKYGEYIRTKTGKILKVDIIEKCKICLQNEYVNIEVINGMRFENIYHQKDIVNHSKNIIDLIQKDDLVNKKLVSNVDKVDDTNIIEWENGEMYSTNIENDKFIKEILTKEMYEPNCFKVVE